MKGRQMLLHLEFQTHNDPEMAERLLRYNVLARSEHRLPVLSCVIYLLASGEAATSPLSRRLPTEQEVVLATWIIRFKKCQSQRPFCCVKFPRKSTSSSEMAITTRLSYTRPVSMQIAC